MGKVKELYIVVAHYEHLTKASIYGPAELKEIRVIQKQLDRDKLYSDARIARLEFIENE